MRSDQINANESPHIEDLRSSELNKADIIEQIGNTKNEQFSVFLQQNPFPVSFPISKSEEASKNMEEILKSLPVEKSVDFATAAFKQMYRIMSIRELVHTLRGSGYDRKFHESIEKFTKKLFGASSARLFTLHRSNEMINYKEDGTFIFTPQFFGIIGSCVKNGKIINLISGKKSPDYNSYYDDRIDITDDPTLVIPFNESPMGTVISVLIITSEGKKAFTAEDVRVAEILSDDISPFLRLYVNYTKEYGTNTTKSQVSHAVHLLLNNSYSPNIQMSDESFTSKKIESIVVSSAADMKNCIMKSLTFTKEEIAKYSTNLFDILSYSNEDKMIMIFKMFNSLDLIKKLNISLDSLASFIFTLRSHYNVVPYHNWIHACDVIQYTYSVIVRAKISQYLTDMEIFALLVAAIAHDTDHRGLNNAFNKKAKTPLGILYPDKPVMEMHHCDAAIKLLTLQENKFLRNVESYDERRHFYYFFINIILATDMDKHKYYIEEFQKIAPHFDKENENHRLLLAQIIIKSADLSNATRRFETSYKLSSNLSEEFFVQGELEGKLGLPISPGFERSKAAHLSAGQIGFYDFVATPLFAVFADFLPEVAEDFEQLKKNRKQWLDMKTEVEASQHK